MLKKIRRKFIVVAMLSVSIVLLAIVGTINIANYVTTARALEVRLQLIADNGGTFQDMMPEKPDDTLSGMEEAGKNHPQDEMPGSFREDLQRQGITPESPYDTRYFTVTLTADGDVDSVDVGKFASISADEAVSYAEELQDAHDH